ncbi:hypothetical protein GKZ90_0020090 [Flavobacterium sp. MC2016-06]|jgi:hypothetical protein|uniref:hypothetical protein n=1 Tax=Flavobacterium sp. MC2016-06 TaxID=2676308 RepID=UPI0012BA663F|nr:hypothetical protein [Flavobacterium sp. MC2016-06]MBU3860894.1 hypothetical protein [Flavobacterium sp. MC2016-06]
MKLIKTFSLAFVLTLINVTAVLADPTPPSPTAKGAGVNALNDDPSDGGEPVPIDQNIIFLMIGGLILGTTVLYKNKIKKASV